jgi:hypothetical protein
VTSYFKNFPKKLRIFQGFGPGVGDAIQRNAHSDLTETVPASWLAGLRKIGERQAVLVKQHVAAESPLSRSATPAAARKV